MKFTYMESAKTTYKKIHSQRCQRASFALSFRSGLVMQEVQELRCLHATCLGCARASACCVPHPCKLSSLLDARAISWDFHKYQPPEIFFSVPIFCLFIYARGSSLREMGVFASAAVKRASIKVVNAYQR